MTSIRWNSEKPMHMTGVDAPSFRHAAPLASVCEHALVVVARSTPYVTGINERPRGLRRCRTG